MAKSQHRTPTAAESRPRMTCDNVQGVPYLAHLDEILTQVQTLTSQLRDQRQALPVADALATLYMAESYLHTVRHALLAL